MFWSNFGNNLSHGQFVFSLRKRDESVENVKIRCPQEEIYIIQDFKAMDPKMQPPEIEEWHCIKNIDVIKHYDLPH